MKKKHWIERLLQRLNCSSISIFYYTMKALYYNPWFAILYGKLI